MNRQPTLFATWAALSLAPPAIAQDTPPHPIARAEVGSRWGAYGAAAGIGALGFVAGGLAASQVDQDCEDLGCLEAPFYGAALLGTIGVAVGAHLGNGRRGNLGLDLLTSAGIWGLGIGPIIASQSGDDLAVAMFLAVPIVQVLLTTEVERATGRARVRQSAERLSVSLVPLAGRLGSGVALRLGW